MRKLRRSSRSRILFDELTMEADEQAMHHAIATISQSDPLVKLLQQVKLGRMKPTDPGLQAITESWLATYSKVITTTSQSKQMLRRIDPMPRVAELIHAGVLPPEHPAVIALNSAYERAYSSASD